MGETVEQSNKNLQKEPRRTQEYQPRILGCNQIAMHNEGLSLTFCLVLVAATVAVVQAYPAEIGEDEQPLVGLDEKRGWNNFHSGYGKRGWNNFAGGYGKRSFDYQDEEPLYEMEAEKRARKACVEQWIQRWFGQARLEQFCWWIRQAWME